MFSSIEDFVIWDAFWRGNDLISDDLLEQAFKKPTLNDGSTGDYGFGWLIADDRVWHNGSWLGAATHVSRGTVDENCIVILDNSASMIVDAMMTELDRVFPSAR